MTFPFSNVPSRDKNEPMKWRQYSVTEWTALSTHVDMLFVFNLEITQFFVTFHLISIRVLRNIRPVYYLAMYCEISVDFPFRMFEVTTSIPCFKMTDS